MLQLEKMFNVLTAFKAAEQILLFRKVPKNNPAARDFRKALDDLYKALDKF